MANRVQHLRGSHTEHSTFTGEKGEISLVTDTSANRIPTGELRVHDGTTAGGLPVKLGTTDKPLTSNIVMGSGYGIDFASYATSGNPSSNLLDDYEEGYWPATLKDATSGGNQSSSTVNGTYVKIGSLCYVNFQIDNISVGSCSGTIYIHGLPFPSSGFSTGSYYTYRTGGGSTIHHSSTTIGNGTTYLRINEQTGTSSDTDNYLTWADIVNNTSAIYFSLVYKV